MSDSRSSAQSRPSARPAARKNVSVPPSDSGEASERSLSGINRLPLPVKAARKTMVDRQYTGRFDAAAELQRDPVRSRERPHGGQADPIQSRPARRDMIAHAWPPPQSARRGRGRGIQHVAQNVPLITKTAPRPNQPWLAHLGQDSSRLLQWQSDRLGPPLLARTADDDDDRPPSEPVNRETPRPRVDPHVSPSRANRVVSRKMAGRPSAQLNRAPGPAWSDSEDSLDETSTFPRLGRMQPQPGGRPVLAAMQAAPSRYKAARKRQETISSDSSESEPSPRNAVRFRLSTKSAKKGAPAATVVAPNARDDVIVLSSDSDEAMSVTIARDGGSNESPAVSESESESDRSIRTSRDRSPSTIPPSYQTRLATALAAIRSSAVLSSSPKRLPAILRRDLRAAFLSYYERRGLPTVAYPNFDEAQAGLNLRLVFQFRLAGLYNAADTDHESPRIEFNRWRCPFCQIHGALPTREVLVRHFLGDHEEIGMDWDEAPIEIDDDGEVIEWQVIAWLPYLGVTPAARPENERDVILKSLRARRALVGPSGLKLKVKTEDEDLHQRFRSMTSMDTLASPSPASQPPDELRKYKFDPDLQLAPKPSNRRHASLASTSTTLSSMSPPPSTVSTRSSSASVASTSTMRDTRSPATSASGSSNMRITPKHFEAYADALRVTMSRASSSRISVTPAKDVPRPEQIPKDWCFPPPDALGPAQWLPGPPPGEHLDPARGHYLPYKDVKFSCRPGGARLYDLIGALPLDEFGVLAWSIVEKEEEMFEADDVCDEDKVMQALWNRWIFSNRNEFVANYFKNTLAFIDKYREMIYLAAGWRALRAWLLVLCINGFLVGSQVAQALRHYEQSVGMDIWAPRDTKPVPRESLTPMSTT